jgi:hypothetical protein
MLLVKNIARIINANRYILVRKISKIPYVKNFDRLITCNNYILKKKRIKLFNNIMSSAKPFIADITCDIINNKDADIKYHYINFLAHHIELYILTILFSMFIDYLYNLYKCFKDQECKVD